MRTLLSVLLLCSLSIEAMQHTVQAQEAPRLSADETAIRQGAEKFVELYNSHNAAAISQLYGEQARHEESSGLVIEGREQIQQAYAAAFEETPKAAISLSLNSLRFLADTVAVEEGSSEYFPDGKTLTSRSKYIVLHLKSAGGWKMASVRSLEEEIVSNYEQLRALEWLVGDWVDEGPDSVVETHGRWDERKNFLLIDFEVRRAGQTATSGTQRIGWDPQAKQIRGWLFDADGGFGQSRWERDEEGWLVKVMGVTQDGKNTAATRRFMPRDADHIIFSSTDRVIDGDRAPDFSVVMSRKAPAPVKIPGSARRP